MKTGQKLIYLISALLASLSGYTTAAPSSNAASQSEQPLELQKRLHQISEPKTKENFHTRHLDQSGKPIYNNRLLLESSPYLKQHAHNPVNWYSWSAEALERAVTENKPIFLSIGYSTCHWCHVMARESFDDLEVAAFLNQHFISIKLDREEHPDVDQTYMSAAALFSGYTGWPLNAFLMPDGAPFYAATYFPKQQFWELLTQIQSYWLEKPEELRQESVKVLQQLKSQTEQVSKVQSITQGLAYRTSQQWLQIYDEFQGGVGTAPKFPNEPMLFLWLDQAVKQQDKELLQALLHTLRMMQQGGIYDQVGGGFHRYATDPGWRIPHFEKMLYTQAQLARIYLYTWQLSGEPQFLRTGEDTLNYLLRELQHPEGVFYSATDADSDGGEGRYFIWNREQLEQALPDPEQFSLAWELFGLDEGSNFDGHNILYLPKSLTEFVIDNQLPARQFLHQLESITQQLRSGRATRSPPARDNKIITAWNAMTIQSLLEAGEILDKPQFLAAAENAAEWLWQNHASNRKLIRSSHNGRAGPEATLEDYAYLARAFIGLYDAGHDKYWLERSIELTDLMLETFWDPEQQQLYQSPLSSLLPQRAQNHRDRVIPSATSMTLEVLHLLGERDTRARWHERALDIFAGIASQVSHQPMAYSYLLTVQENGGANPFVSVRYAAKGAIRAQLRSSEDGISLHITLEPGWHINAHQQKNPKLIPTTVAGNNLSPVDYPTGEPLQVSFTPEPVNVYSKELVLPLKLENPGQRLNETVTLTLQACSTQQCLAPEALEFRVSRH